ncbi:TRAP transporter small permease [Rhodobacteraceae bacterium M382]|nr:TRAP transporter small permease [Rhodobacteraceae bacterium M382]
MPRILNLVFRLPVALASLALFLLMAMTFADVILRSAFNAPIEAATELTRLLMALIVFSALPMISFQGHHIAVDLLDGLFARFRLERARDVAISLMCGGMLLWPANRMIDLAERARSYGDQTEYLNIPTYYIGWFIAISAFVTAAALILRGGALALGRDPEQMVRHD